MSEAKLVSLVYCAHVFRVLVCPRGTEYKPLPTCTIHRPTKGTMEGEKKKKRGLPFEEMLAVNSF